MDTRPSATSRTSGSPLPHSSPSPTATRATPPTLRAPARTHASPARASAYNSHASASHARISAPRRVSDTTRTQQKEDQIIVMDQRKQNLTLGMTKREGEGARERKRERE